ncbi:MAG TPA: hypothetical protein VK488_03780 [Gaiellaceae bacterium]|nr:hypothetical protein [Gaiellaceae bacterium]
MTPSVTLYEDADGNEVARITPPTGPDNCINFNPWGAIRVTEEGAEEVHRQLLLDPARIPTLLPEHLLPPTAPQPTAGVQPDLSERPVGGIYIPDAP